MFWPEEKKFLKSLNSPHKIQNYLDRLTYNPNYTVASPRYVMLSGVGHCLEGCLLAASALELQGHKPLIVNLMAHNDDYHAIAVYQTKTGWGSFSKSNTTLLAGRRPVYQSVRELVMSYFDFYFNVKGKHALYGFSQPINLNRYNKWHWRTSETDLIEMGIEFSELPHNELVELNVLKKWPAVPKRLQDACFLGADPNGLYRPD